MSLERILLSNPSLLAPSGAKRSWIQLAKCGSFVSNRYGKFSITRDDLSTMLRNFDTVTPKDPTELPIDYDHLSMDPKKPGDGAAAGWMKRLELRDDGETLWAEVEWTPQAAEHIKNREYRFVSPSFVKDHVHKDGSKIGTTLLAAAITNHPFLEGMNALTLYSLNRMGEITPTSAQRRDHLAMSVDAPDVIRLPFAEYEDFDDCVNKNQDKDDPKAFCGYLKNKIEATSLSEVGQRVMISPGHARTQDEIGGTFEITEVVGDGEDAFVTVKDANGVPHKWFRATELLPASATPANPIQPNLVPATGSAGVPGAPGSGLPSDNPLAQAAGAAGGAGVAALPGGEAQVPVDPNDPTAAATVAATKGPDGEAVLAEGPGGKAAAIKPGDEDEDDEDAESDDEDAEDEDDEDAEEGDDPFAEPTAQAATTGAAVKKTGGDEVEMLIKQRVAAVLAAGKKQQQPRMFSKGIATMMFTLRNDKNEEIRVSDEQLAKAGIVVVPEGSTAIPVSELTDMKSTITNLSTRVETLAAETVANKHRSVLLELHSELNRLSKGGFIRKATRDALEAQFGKATDLSAFRALAATFTTPIVNLDTEHGSGGDAPADKAADATQKLISLSQQIVKERGMSLRDATIEAGKQLSAEAEQYQERFRPQAVGV